MLTEVDEVKYVVKIQNQVIAGPFSSLALANAHTLNLPVHQQALAEVAPVTAEGKQLLLG